MDDARIATRADEDAIAGVRNLLVNVGGVKAGTKLLIVNARGGGVEPEVSDLIEREALTMGALVDVMWTDNARALEEISPVVAAAYKTADVTIFNHRIGAIVRFLPRERGTFVINYAWTRALLASPMARTHPAYWTEMLKKLHPALGRAKSWRVTCPNGTDLSCPIEPGAAPAHAVAGGQTFSTAEFPAGVFVPLDALECSGKLAMRWFNVSGVRYFDPVQKSFDDVVIATVDKGRMTKIDGKPATVAAVRAFFDEIGKRVNKDPYVINSWHAGVNASAVPTERLDEDIDAWMWVAHNHPRVAHFHVMGEDVPGEYSLIVLDPTIEIDGEKLWDRGTFAFAGKPEVQSAIAKFGDPAFALTKPAIGF